MLSALNQSIHNTVVYADVFDFPLTLDELHASLISRREVSKSSIEKAVSRSRVIRTDEHITLPGRTRLIQVRRRNTSYLSEKMRSARSAARLLGWIPTISGIFVTGSLAARNATKNDDIDFLIITKAGWLWTTRLIVAVLSTMLGKYRTRSTHEVNNKWCFNMWLDETRLAVPEVSQTLYTAHEVVQAVPIVNKDRVHAGFIAANAWVKTVLANTVIPRGRLRPKTGGINVIERVFFALQRRYMHAAQTTEKVGAHYAFFHPRNTGEMILREFKKRGGRV